MGVSISPFPYNVTSTVYYINKKNNFIFTLYTDMCDSDYWHRIKLHVIKCV